ncbi:MAG: hypothetical protein WD184_03805 [Acidimicrobiia bacterium]
MRFMGAGIQWWIGVILAGLAAWQFKARELDAWMWVSVAVAVVGFWSAGIASNYALRGNPLDVPNGTTRLNIGSALAGAALLIGAVVA